MLSLEAQSLVNKPSANLLWFFRKVQAQLAMSICLNFADKIFYVKYTYQLMYQHFLLFQC